MRRQLGAESVLLHGRCWRHRTDGKLAPKASWHAHQDQWLRWALTQPCHSSLVFSGRPAAANAAQAFGWFAPELGELVPIRCTTCDAWHIRTQPAEPDSPR